MKKIILSALTLLVVCLCANAQDTLYGYKYKPEAHTPPKTRINVYGAYVFDDDVESYYDSYNYFNGTIKGGLQYGAGIEFMPRPQYGVEILWIGQSTTVPMHYSYSTIINSDTHSTLDLDLNWAMVAFGRKLQKPGSPVEGYGGLMLGCLFASAKNPYTDNSGSGEKFAWGMRLGGNIWTSSNKIAIKLEAKLLSAVQAAGGGFYFGTGGAGAGVSTYSTMYQFSIGGGLVFAVGK